MKVIKTIALLLLGGVLMVAIVFALIAAFVWYLTMFENDRGTGLFILIVIISFVGGVSTTAGMLFGEAEE